MSESKADTKFARLKWRRSVDRWRAKAATLADAVKAGFDPNQPRVPAGSREGGRWTRSGGRTGSVQADPKQPGKKPADPELKVPVDKSGSRTNEPLDAPPKVSKGRPPTVQERNRTAKEVARWLDKARKVPAPGRIRLFLLALEGVSWLNKFYPFIQAYFDDPKPVNQLNKDAQTKRPGYERHHIVEQTPARQEGFERDLVDAPENIVSVPKFKHEDISGYYQTKQKKYGGRSLREHLRGKSWEERRKAGLEVLEEFGVLRP